MDDWQLFSLTRPSAGQEEAYIKWTSLVSVPPGRGDDILKIFFRSLQNSSTPSDICPTACGRAP